jgi:hypothetical protein
LNSAFILDAKKVLSFLDDILLKLPKDRLLPPLLDELKSRLTEIVFDRESIEKMQVFQQKDEIDLHEAQKQSIFKKKGVLTEYDLFPQQQFSTDKRLCFVLMPFDERHNSVYKNVIKPATAEVGLEAKRADDIFGVKPIIQDIWEYINKAEVIIADLSGKNANVFYEVGLRAYPKIILL